MLALESVFLNNKNVKRKGSNKTQTKICLLQVFEMHPPVPRSWASLNGVQLNQEFVGWIEKTGHIFSPLCCLFNRVGDKGVDLAISMHKSSMKYYSRRLLPRLKDMAITTNTILNVFHINEDIVKWIETFICTISSVLIRIFKLGLWECKKASEERIAQVKKTMNPKFSKLPRMILFLLTISQVCSSTVSSGFQIFQHKRDPNQEWFFNWDLEKYPDLEVDEGPNI